MRLSIPQVQEILRESADLPDPWRERVVALCQDWAGLVQNEVQALEDGVQLAGDLKLGAQALAELETVEKILALPLCERCRKVVREG